MKYTDMTGPDWPSGELVEFAGHKIGRSGKMQIILIKKKIDRLKGLTIHIKYLSAMRKFGHSLEKSPQIQKKMIYHLEKSGQIPKLSPKT